MQRREAKEPSLNDAILQSYSSPSRYLESRLGRILIAAATYMVQYEYTVHCTVTLEPRIVATSCERGGTDSYD